MARNRILRDGQRRLTSPTMSGSKHNRGGMRRKMGGLLLPALLSATAIQLTSCIDSHEEYWLEADGGGRAEVTYTLPAAVARMHGGDSGIREIVTGFLHKTPEITSSGCEVVTRENRTCVTIRAAFDSALDLKDLASGQSIQSLPSAASHLAGQVRAGLSGRTLDFNRTITPSKALPGSAFLPASQFAGHRLVYIMHLPAAATDSNATRVEDSGRTLVWDIPLEQALGSPITTRFKMEIPVPWTLVTTIALPLSLAGGFAWVRLRKSRAN